MELYGVPCLASSNFSFPVPFSPNISGKPLVFLVSIPTALNLLSSPGEDLDREMEGRKRRKGNRRKNERKTKGQEEHMTTIVLLDHLPSAPTHKTPLLGPTPRPSPGTYLKYPSPDTHPAPLSWDLPKISLSWDLPRTPILGPT